MIFWGPLSKRNLSNYFLWQKSDLDSLSDFYIFFFFPNQLWKIFNRSLCGAPRRLRGTFLSTRPIYPQSPNTAVDSQPPNITLFPLNYQSKLFYYFILFLETLRGAICMQYLLGNYYALLPTGYVLYQHLAYKAFISWSAKNIIYHIISVPKILPLF